MSSTKSSVELDDEYESRVRKCIPGQFREFYKIAVYEPLDSSDSSLDTYNRKFKRDELNGLNMEWPSSFDSSVTEAEVDFWGQTGFIKTLRQTDSEILNSNPSIVFTSSYSYIKKKNMNIIKEQVIPPLFSFKHLTPSKESIDNTEQLLVENSIDVREIPDQRKYIIGEITNGTLKTLKEKKIKQLERDLHLAKAKTNDLVINNGIKDILHCVSICFLVATISFKEEIFDVIKENEYPLLFRIMKAGRLVYIQNEETFLKLTLKRINEMENTLSEVKTEMSEVNSKLDQLLSIFKK